MSEADRGEMVATNEYYDGVAVDDSDNDDNSDAEDEGVGMEDARQAAC